MWFDKGDVFNDGLVRQWCRNVQAKLSDAYTNWCRCFLCEPGYCYFIAETRIGCISMIVLQVCCLCIVLN